MLKKIYIIALAALLAPKLLFAQDSKGNDNATVKAARKEYLTLRFASAIKLLERELKDHPEDLAAQEMIANSYRNIKDYDKAVYWYSMLAKAPAVKPQWALNYAEALASKGQYETAEVWYRKYLAMAAKDERASAFTKFYPEVKVFMRNAAEWQIDYLNINTKAAEYSPMLYKNGLIFASNRQPKGNIVRRVFGWDETPFSDLYEVDNREEIRPVNLDTIRKLLRTEPKAVTGKKYKANDDDTAPTSNDTRTIGQYNPRFLRDTLGEYLSAQIKAEPVKGEVNTKYHEGASALLPDSALMFTRNNYANGKYRVSKEGVNKLKMFTAKAPDWKIIEPFPYNNDQYSVGHPALNQDGTLLIFVSDMPGGFGGTDLYYSRRANLTEPWGKPVNMGPVINTEGDEMFPTLYQDSTLFFSSTGHPGLGGLDVFQVALHGIIPLHEPINLGAPVNSPVDDFGLIREEGGNTGYFTSNRNGSDDIYSFYHKPFAIRLHVAIVDAATNEPVCYSTVSMKPEGVQPLELDQVCTFGSELKSETNYTITAGNTGYSTETGSVSTKGVYNDTTLNLVLRLKRVNGEVLAREEGDMVPMDAKGTGCDDLRSNLTIGKIYYDLDKATIRNDAQAPLNQLVQMLQKDPELRLIIASYCDSRASQPYNIDLSARRSKAARAYLEAQGISDSRIHIEFFGESHLVNNCADGVECSEADQQLNRRSEFFLMKDGKKVLTMGCDWLQKEFKNR